MRRPAALSLWTLLALLSVQGCSDSDPSGPADPASSTVTGIVINNATRVPVAGALVRIGEASLRTGADGRYEFKDLTLGAATIRCTAPGYVEFEENITVSSGVAFRDIALTRMDVFELGDFALFVPAAVDVPRGILLALGGPNTKAFSNREPFGAPTPETEASLQALGQSLRDMAANRQFAILGTSLAGMADGPESDQLILDAIRAAEDASGRSGLSTLPLLVYGMSYGAPQASGFTARHPERVAGLFLKVPESVTALTSGEPLRVPTLMVLAELDGFVDNAALTAAFEANRRAGAFWALATESGVPHHSLSLAQRVLTLAWFGDLLDLRMPASPFGPLRHLVDADGWLGEQSTGDVSPWATYPGDHASASWLPSQVAAESWQDFVDLQRGPDPGGAYPDVTGVYDLTAVVTDSRGWGYEGWHLTSELTIRHSTDRERFGGTFDSVLYTDLDGQSEEGRSGGISGSIDARGRVVMELLVEGSQYASRYEGTLASGRIEGTFRAGELSGTFVAERRPVP